MGKKVFVRAGLNVPLDGDCNITDDTRIRAAVPTLKYLLEKGAKVLLTSHLGRPKDGPEDKFRLNPVVPRLTELLRQEVGKCDDCIGADVTAKVGAMADGEILVLENVRFYKRRPRTRPPSPRSSPRTPTCLSTTPLAPPTEPTPPPRASPSSSPPPSLASSFRRSSTTWTAPSATQRSPSAPSSVAQRSPPRSESSSPSWKSAIRLSSEAA